MEKTKFKRVGSFTFGGSSRFGSDFGGKAPGPGQYNPKDPALYCDTKVGFATSTRGKITGLSHAAPGPGAYEVRSTVGDGLMFTATGRGPSQFVRSRSQPGPGAYSPTPATYSSSQKVSFGCAVRGSFITTNQLPGPG